MLIIVVTMSFNRDLLRKKQRISQSLHAFINIIQTSKRFMKYMSFSVAVTAHLTSTTTTTGSILKFDNVRFSVGINDLAAFKSTGKFVCERKGLYMISSSIRSDSNDAHYYIYLNGNAISYTITGFTSSPIPVLLF